MYRSVNRLRYVLMIVSPEVAPRDVSFEYTSPRLATRITPSC
jgi:hypothetical protein